MYNQEGLKNIFVVLLVSVFLTQCGQQGNADVSGIKLDIRVVRFDRYLFEKTDTGSMQQSVEKLQSEFPYFTPDFITNILGLPVWSGLAGDSSARITLSELRRFITVTRPLYDSLNPKFKETGWLDKDLTNGFKHVKYYFPDYKIPAVVAYVGPFNAPGIAITNQALAIGLQLYAGKDFSFYNTQQGLEMFPSYISRTFEPEYIPVNAMKAVGEDIFPDRSAGKPLIYQMIEKGKQWWLLNKFLPNTADSLKTGFTESQLKWCSQNEGLIWNYVLQNNDPYTTEPALIKDYIGEAPSTPGMPDASPGNIGQWIGLQIVQKYASKHSELSPAVIMNTEAKKIFAEAKYKPR